MWIFCSDLEGRRKGMGSFGVDGNALARDPGAHGAAEKQLGELRPRIHLGLGDTAVSAMVEEEVLLHLSSETQSNGNTLGSVERGGIGLHPRSRENGGVQEGCPCSHLGPLCHGHQPDAWAPCSPQRPRSRTTLGHHALCL